jgi:hypothetical protein
MNELSDHDMDVQWQACATVQLYCTPTKFWCAATALCSQTNLWHVSAQGLEMFISGLNKIPIPLKKLEVYVICISADCFFVDFLED